MRKRVCCCSFLSFALLAWLVKTALAIYDYIEKVSEWLLVQLHAPPGTEAAWPGPINLTNISGVPMAPFVTSTRMAELSNGSFLHREDDVWVVTYPKSGTTWTLSMAAAILGHRGFEPNDLALRELCPWPEFATWKGGPDTVEKMAEFPSPRVLKSHGLASGFLDGQIRKGRVVFLMRNALDVGVSYYFHNKDFPNIFDYDGEWEDFFPLFAQGNVANGNYFQHLASWWPLRDDPNLLFLRYEEMLQAPEATIQRIASFMQVGRLPEQQVAEIRRLTSWEAQRKKEAFSWDLFFARMVGWRRYYRLRQGSTRVDAAGPRYSREMCDELERQYDEILQPLGVPRAWVLGSRSHPECTFLLNSTNSSWQQGSASKGKSMLAANVAAGMATHVGCTK